MKAEEDLRYLSSRNITSVVGNGTAVLWHWQAGASRAEIMFTENSTTMAPMDVQELLLSSMGAKRKDIGSVIILTCVYSLIFLTGVIGNVSTCVVILRNSYMHTSTNYYLFNLAISDVLTLFIALPPELYAIWEAYPWRFGEPFCIVKSFLSEMTYYSSVLTLTAFTVERYVAICHPIRSQTLSGLSRAVKAIIFTWILACLCALPYAICTRVFYYVTDHSTGEQLKESLLCNIPQVWIEEMKFVFQVSTFAFFVGPMTLITVLYVQIGRKIRRSEVCTNTADRTAITAAFRARRAVLRMLVAVVVAFFICWAPFHAQRLMTLYIKRDDWNEELIVVQSHLFYVSGILYFFSSTVNPILYNLLSRKYRQAFKRTLCRCCIDMEGLPSFYKLKAKFNIRQTENRDSHSSVRYLYPEKPILVATYNNNNDNRKQEIVPRKCVPSSKETYIKLTTKGGSGESSSGSSSGHAHSDGRLHYHCRHKMSCCRRHCQGLDPQLGRQYLSRSFNNIHYCDAESKRPKRRTRDPKRLPVATFDSTCQCRDWRIDATML